MTVQEIDWDQVFPARVTSGELVLTREQLADRLSMWLAGSMTSPPEMPRTTGGYNMGIRVMTRLKKVGIIERRGPPRGGKWVLLPGPYDYSTAMRPQFASRPNRGAYR